MVISVTGFTAARSQAIEDEAIVSGAVDGSGDLILTKFGGGTVNAGAVIGPSGPSGSGLIICTSSTRPSSPSEGDAIWETDTNRIYVWPGGSWRWIWSQNGEDKVRVGPFDLGTTDDATTAATWPGGLETTIDIPPWAKDLEAFARIGAVKQVTATGNTELEILIGSRVVAHQRIRWTTRGAGDETDIVLMGTCAVDDLAGSTVSFRVKGDRVSGTGALRVDDVVPSTAYLSGRFTDA